VGQDPAREVETARLLLEAARYLGETLDLQRVYERFHEIMAEAIPHDGVVVSSYEAESGTIRCDFAWVDGELLDVSIFPPLRLQAEGGMQSEVIRSGAPLLTNDVAGRVRDSGTYYDVDREGTMRKVPDEGPPKAQAAMMVPVKHEGEVVGVVQLMSDRTTYDRRQLELAEGIVAQLGAAVRNARLHEERLRLEASAAAARAVAVEREQAAHVLDAVGDGIFAVAADGTIAFWNRAAGTLTGLGADDVLGRSLADLGEGWAAVASSVPAGLHDEPPRPVALPVEGADRELWLSFLAVRTQRSVVYAFRDVTAERQLEERQNEFVATVSHELRTPMTAVLGAARTLLRPDLDLADDLRRQLLEMIAAQAARLARVTESVLLVGRLDRDEVVVERERVEVEQLVAETLDMLAPTIPAAIAVSSEAGPGCAVLGDRSRIQQVLVNLVDNAVKYSPGGGAVGVRAARRGDVVLIEVADEGGGIPAADLDRIFEKFDRGDPARRLAAGGTGLGLYISRELVERMGGSIGVASTPGAGSTFTVELPAAD